MNLIIMKFRVLKVLGCCVFTITKLVSFFSYDRFFKGPFVNYKAEHKIRT